MSITSKYCLLILIGFLIGMPAHESTAQPVPVTPHELLPEISIDVIGKDLPRWKSVWDKARKTALQGDFEEALRLYRALLVMKDNLEDARWEMVRVLMYLERWEEASGPLEHLIGTEPDSALYISSLGKVMWEMEQYERAVDLFEKIYVKDSTDQMALAGLVEGLTKLGRKSEALPYLEQLSRQKPTNRGVRSYLAFLYYEDGNYEKARPHLTILARSDEVETEVLYKTAKTYEYLGLDDRASIYWERFAARDPANIEAQSFLAKYYEGVGQPGRALAYYRMYLDQFPDDRAVKQRVGRIIDGMEEKKESSAPVGFYAATDNEDQIANLKKTIRRHESAGRYNDTVPLYRQLFELSPGDPEITAFLVSDLIAIEENKGTVPMFMHLSDIAAGNIDIYRSVARLFRQMKREEMLLAVLRRIHELEPEDSSTTRELAILYLAKGDLKSSQEHFAKLPDVNCSDIDCLQARVMLSEKLNRPEHELRYCEAILKMQPDLYRLRQRAVYLAAQMGLLDTALYHAGYLQYLSSSEEYPELRVLIADAYRNSGYFTSARERYLNIIEELAVSEEAEADHIRVRSWLGIAESYIELDHVYEAEQTLRSALADVKDHIPVLEALFQLAVDNGDVEKGEIWLQAINREMDRMSGLSAQTDPDWRRMHLRAGLYAAAGDYGQAVALDRKAVSAAGQKWNETNAQDNSAKISPEFSIKVRLAENLMRADDFAAAEKIINDLLVNYSTEPRLFVLLEQVYRSAGMHIDLQKVIADTDTFAKEDFARQLVLAKLYREYEDFPRYLEMSDAAAARKPESLSAQLHFIEAGIANGKYPAALESLERLYRSYPDNSRLLSKQVELLAKVGKFEEAMDVGDVILAEAPARIDIVLLQARILWEMKRWKDSVRLYESVVNPPVEEILQKKMQELALTVSPDFTAGFWRELLTLSMGAPQTLSEIVMSPLHAVDFSENSRTVNSAVAPYYALYCWQDRFNKELSVRRSVMRWEYYHAANKLEHLIDEYGREDFLVFDLAGLYSRLDRLGDEADLYRELQEQNGSFQGLAEAVQRNDLKRRPHMSLTYIMQEDDGWDGYKGIKQGTVKGEGWYFPATNQKWSLDLARIEYEATNNTMGLWAWRSMLAYDIKLNQALSLSLGGGIQDLGSGYSTSPLFSGTVTGRIADEMQVVLSAKQDITPDTLASLTRNIKKRDYRAELVFNLIPRIVFGGYHDYTDYSDSNWTKNSRFWASYILLPEPTLVKISYSYDHYDSDEGQKPGVATADGFALRDHPYWSPQNYWITRFSLYLKHQLSNDALARGVPSYYTLEYSLGYDSEDNDLHELKGGLYIEIARNFILGGSYAYVDLDAFQHHQTMFTFMYRW